MGVFRSLVAGCSLGAGDRSGGNCLSTSFSVGVGSAGSGVGVGEKGVGVGAGVGAGAGVGVGAAGEKGVSAAVGGGVSLRVGGGVGVGARIGAGLERASGSAGAEVRSSFATGAGSEEGRLKKTLAIPTKPATIRAIATNPKINQTLRLPSPFVTTAGAVLTFAGD